MTLSVEQAESLAGLVVGTLLYSGVINYLVYRNLGMLLLSGESPGLASVNALSNQLPYAGGLVAKGTCLMNRHSLAYRRCPSTVEALDYEVD